MLYISLHFEKSLQRNCGAFGCMLVLYHISKFSDVYIYIFVRGCFRQQQMDGVLEPPTRDDDNNHGEPRLSKLSKNKRRDRDHATPSGTSSGGQSKGGLEALDDKYRALQRDDVIYDDASQNRHVADVLRRQLDDANRSSTPVTQSAHARSSKKPLVTPPRKTIDMVLNDKYVTAYSGRTYNTNQNNRNVADADSQCADDAVNKQVVRSVVQRVQRRR